MECQGSGKSSGDHRARLSVRWMDLGDGKGPREGRRDSGSLVPTPSTRTVDFDVIAAANVTKGQ